MKKLIVSLSLAAVLCSAHAQQHRYKIGLIDLMLLKRQKLGALPLAKALGADGIEVDMGGLGTRVTFDSQLSVDSIRRQFMDKSKDLSLEIMGLAMTGYYAQSFCGRADYQQSIRDCITTMKAMNVKLGFLPMGVQCDLKKNPEVRDSVIARLKWVGEEAKKAGVVIAIETSLDAAAEVQLLKAIHSPNIKICFNLADPIAEGRKPEEEINILGRDRIAVIHASNRDSVWLQNDTQVNLPAIKAALDKIKWSGWLLVERSRDATRPRDVKYNYGANVAYLKKIFQE